MKIKPEHYIYMSNAIVNVLKNYEIKRLMEKYKDEKLSFKQFYHDCLYRAKLSTWLCDNVYSYANDKHIETALKRIMKEQGLTKLWEGN